MSLHNEQLCCPAYQSTEMHQEGLLLHGGNPLHITCACHAWWGKCNTNKQRLDELQFQRVKGCACQLHIGLWCTAVQADIWLPAPLFSRKQAYFFHCHFLRLKNSLLLGRGWDLWSLLFNVAGHYYPKWLSVQVQIKDSDIKPYEWLKKCGKKSRHGLREMHLSQEARGRLWLKLWVTLEIYHDLAQDPLVEPNLPSPHPVHRTTHDSHQPGLLGFTFTLYNVKVHPKTYEVDFLHVTWDQWAAAASCLSGRFASYY